MDKFEPHGQLSSFKVERFVKFRQMPRPKRVSFMASVLFQNMKKSERESIEFEMDLFWAVGLFSDVKEDWSC